MEETEAWCGKTKGQRATLGSPSLSKALGFNYLNLNGNGTGT